MLPRHIREERERKFNGLTIKEEFDLRVRAMKLNPGMTFVCTIGVDFGDGFEGKEETIIQLEGLQGSGMTTITHERAIEIVEERSCFELDCSKDGGHDEEDGDLNKGELDLAIKIIEGRVVEQPYTGVDDEHDIKEMNKFRRSGRETGLTNVPNGKYEIQYPGLAEACNDTIPMDSKSKMRFDPEEYDYTSSDDVPTDSSLSDSMMVYDEY